MFILLLAKLPCLGLVERIHEVLFTKLKRRKKKKKEIDI